MSEAPDATAPAAATELPAPEIIRIKRDGGALTPVQIDTFVHGLTSGRWTEGQVAALAMATVLRGMDTSETVALTRAMTASGDVLHWDALKLGGPIVDKHSSGGVGDKTSLMLAPLLAACGAVVPMLSGRGLGHTGGTLDKLESLAGYNTNPPRHVLDRVLREAGCAVVGASERVAPADKRLYAIRDVTATVESVPLITASILSKKLAAGTQALVMDVKLGNGAFCATLAEAQALAQSIVSVARGAGLPTRALITDMNQVLGTTAGNALEMAEAVDYLTGELREPRLHELTLTLAAHALQLCGLADSLEAGRLLAETQLRSGAAADRLARMVRGLGGPADVLRHQPPRAPVQCELPAPHAGVITGMDTRAIGLVVVALGGGRGRADDRIDPRVGLSHVLPVGRRVQAGEPLLRIHARDTASAEAAAAALLVALQLEASPATLQTSPLVTAVIDR